MYVLKIFTPRSTSSPTLKLVRKCWLVVVQRGSLLESAPRAAMFAEDYGCPQLLDFEKELFTLTVHLGIMIYVAQLFGSVRFFFSLLSA